ncbi:MAG: hypothetical protein LBJ35_07370 [Spirochaetaceae bacterium]|jgi:hypothetical protein|nr:hypothetical protein [Spirochaetaceae bacterium]
MYQVALNTKGPKKINDTEFCTAGLSCKKCQWFIKHSKVSFKSFGEIKSMKSTICSFNKKPYPDMTHKLVIYEGS